MKPTRKIGYDRRIIEEFRDKQEDYDYFDTIFVSKVNEIQTSNSLLTYKYNYYNYYLKTNNQIILNQLFENYFEGFNWTVDYYLNVKIDNEKYLDSNCMNWDWYYRYCCVPFVSDLYSYLSKHYETINKNISNNSEPLTTDQQLFYIIPKKYLEHINKNLFNKLNIYKFISPTSSNVDTLHKGKLWECHAMVPLVDCDVIRKIV